jgi:hypothetical protein
MSNTVAQVEAILRAEFGGLAYARSEFPMLTDWGIEDYSETIHSCGMNYLAALGRHHARWALSEYPVAVSNPPADGPSVRLDAVWWSRPAGQPELLSEFERYEPGTAKRSLVAEKARHLLLAHQHLPPGPRLLLLCAWAISGKVPDRLEELRELGRKGFRLADCWVPGVGAESRFVVATPIFAEAGGRLYLREVLL